MEQSKENKSVLKCSSCGTKFRVPHDRGDLEVTCPNCNGVEEWSEDEIKFIGKKSISSDAIRKLIEKRAKKIKGYVPRVGVFGVTGVGKSSLCNAIFGSDVAKISDVAACTRSPQEIQLKSSGSEPGIVLIDVPGVGETTERDEEYFQLYKSLAPTLDLVIWVIKADDRAYAVSQKAYLEILKPNLKKCPVVFVVNQVDKLPPLRDWDEVHERPGQEKEANVQRKIGDVAKAFDVSTDIIIPVSVEEKYNLTGLVSLIVDILPNEKKYSFAREAKEEVKTEGINAKAEKGVWEAIKEWCGDLWEENKDLIVSAAATFATKFIKGLFKK
ncbi:GTPase family protein [Kerstersia similis]|uniref:GTPase family protein n=1 Tax=Kerstersia similis TaxID=206505 RepID=UPI0039F000C3